MKRILLASTAIAFVGGAASAELTWSGAATFEYVTGGDAGVTNAGQATTETREEGFDWGVDINAALSMDLDNGLNVTVGAELDLVDDEVNGTGSLDVSDFVLSLSGETASLHVGDTNTAAATHWSAAGDMESDGFSAQDGGAGDVILRGDIAFGDVDASVSYYIGDRDGGATAGYQGTTAELTQLSVGVSADLGGVTAKLAYQEEGEALDAVADYTRNQILGLSVSGTAAGLSWTVATVTKSGLAAAADETSTGVKVSYPVGDVTLSAYYVSEDAGNGDANMGVSIDYASGPLTIGVDFEDDQGNDGVAVDGKYDLGNGLELIAGFQDGDNRDDDGIYLGGNYDLGGGASLSLVHVDLDETRTGDGEYMSGDWEDGTTIALSFSF
ncbi:MAG: porin [Pseudomonadota bacterium]